MTVGMQTSDTGKTGPEALAELAVQWVGAVAASRDKDAFSNLYQQFAPKVKSYIKRRGADDATADDLAQETLVQVWRKAALYDARKSAPSSWIFTIARNLSIDRLRRQKFHEVELADEMLESGLAENHRDHAVENVHANQLEKLISRLPADQAEVIRLSFFDGLSHQEIGKKLDLPLGTVKSRLRLAFGKLREALGERL